MIIHKNCSIYTTFKKPHIRAGEEENPPKKKNRLQETVVPSDSVRKKGTFYRAIEKAAAGLACTVCNRA
jgi:hypothetical protein